MEARKKATKTYAPIKEEKLIYEFHGLFIEKTRDHKRTYAKTIEETIVGLKTLLQDLSKDNDPELNLLNWQDHLKKITKEHPELNREQAIKKAKSLFKPFKMFNAMTKLWKEIIGKQIKLSNWPKTKKGTLEHLIKYLESKLNTMNNK